MSKIFELFGYRLDNWSAAAQRNLSQAWCPFMNSECDGGGNRYLSSVDLDRALNLKPFFPSKQRVNCGVCSLRVRPNEQPWIVCPRRLLSLRRNAGVDYQAGVRNDLISCSGLPAGQRYRVWSEVKMKLTTTGENNEARSFDYTFDYILAGSKRVRLDEISDLVGRSQSAVRRIAESNEFTLASRGELWVDDFPADPILIVEIMTSSTSGGNRNNRTQIAMAFEDAILNREEHNGPGINYRQVWARMVSQLIVKSQVGLAWGGKTIWLLQDVLADYISSTTALDLACYISEEAAEVNLLAFGFGDIDQARRNEEVLPLRDSRFYSGQIDERGGARPHQTSGFIDIVKLAAPPPKARLWKSLFLKMPCGAMST